MATIATRKSTFMDDVTPARPIANKTSARKTADTAPAAQIGMVKVPAAASTSSMFLTFRLHSAPHPYPGPRASCPPFLTKRARRPRSQGSVGAVRRERTSVSQPPGDGCESPMDKLGTPQLIAPPVAVGQWTDLAAMQEF